MEPRVYRMSTFAQVIYCTMGLGFFGAGVFSLIELGLWAIIIALPLSLPGIYLCRWALNSRLTLSETEVSVRYAFSENSVRLSEIEGWREESRGKGGLFWVLQLKDNLGEFSIDQKFAVDDAFFDFLSKLRNLNEMEIRVVP